MQKLIHLTMALFMLSGVLFVSTGCKDKSAAESLEDAAKSAANSVEDAADDAANAVRDASN